MKILLGPFAGADLLRVGTSGSWADRYLVPHHDVALWSFITLCHSHARASLWAMRCAAFSRRSEISWPLTSRSWLVLLLIKWLTLITIEKTFSIFSLSHLDPRYCRCPPPPGSCDRECAWDRCGDMCWEDTWDCAVLLKCFGQNK